MGMTRFEECLAFVLEREGGFVDNPKDRGGATNKGVTQRVYDEWRERKGYEIRSVAQIEQSEVMAIYNEGYWNPVRGIKLPAPLDLALFDAAVQHGPVRAVKWLQEILATPADGRLGDMTLTKMADYITRSSVSELVTTYNRRRVQFYSDIVEKNPSQKVFARGWGNRMIALSKECLDDVAA